jgi:hypothetical protein
MNAASQIEYQLSGMRAVPQYARMVLDMQKLRAFADKLRALISPDGAPDAAIEDRSVFSRLAVPYTFSPSLSLGDGLRSIGACLTRIFSACGLFAVWGGISAVTLSAIGNRFWRAIALLPLVLLFLAGLATLMIAISFLERMIAPKRPTRVDTPPAA